MFPYPMNACTLPFPAWRIPLSKAWKLFEHILANVQPDETALNNMVDDILKKRADNKLNKSSIFWGWRHELCHCTDQNRILPIALPESELKITYPR